MTSRSSSKGIGGRVRAVFRRMENIANARRRSDPHRRPDPGCAASARDGREPREIGRNSRRQNLNCCRAGAFPGTRLHPRPNYWTRSTAWHSSLMNAQSTRILRISAEDRSQSQRTEVCNYGFMVLGINLQTSKCHPGSASHLSKWDFSKRKTHPF